MKRVLALILALSLAIFMFAGCGTGTTAGTPSTKDNEGEKTIAIMMMSVADEFIYTVYKAAEAHAKELGYKTVSHDAAHDAALQASTVSDFIQQGVDAVLLCPQDAAALSDSVIELNEAGIPVVLVDRGVNEGKFVALCASDNYEFGTVCILGAGPMGLLFASMAKANGATKVIVSEPHEFRREKALKCGATRVVNPLTEDLKQVCLDETDGLGVDHCIEAVGHMLGDAIDMIRPGGKVIMFGHDETATPPIRLAEIVRKEAEIHGSFLGKYYFEKTARIIESGILPLEEIVSHTFPLSEYEKGLELLRQGKALKVVIYPEEYPEI